MFSAQAVDRNNYNLKVLWRSRSPADTRALQARTQLPDKGSVYRFISYSFLLCCRMDLKVCGFPSIELGRCFNPRAFPPVWSVSAFMLKRFCLTSSFVILKIANITAKWCKHSSPCCGSPKEHLLFIFTRILNSQELHNHYLNMGQRARRCLAAQTQVQFVKKRDATTVNYSSSFIAGRSCSSSSCLWEMIQYIKMDNCSHLLFPTS